MRKIFPILILSHVTLLAFAGNTKTSLDGIRVNPGSPLAASDYRVSLHEGDRTSWQVQMKLTTRDYPLSSPQDAAILRDRVAEILARYGEDTRDPKSPSIPKAAENALKEARRLLDLMVNDSNLKGQDYQDAAVHVREALGGFNNVFRYPIEGDIWLGLAPIRILENLSNNVAAPSRGEAKNNPQKISDPSSVDPINSSFWQNPGEISGRDLKVGYGRKKAPALPEICAYDSPKTGYGIHGGFTVKCGKDEYEMKFGSEVHSGPFNSRIVALLGFHAAPLDYVPAMKVKYDRRILKEFNSRKDLRIRIYSMFGFDYAKIPIQTDLDVFSEAVLGAVTKEGQRWIPADELRRDLVGNLPVSEWKKDTSYNLALESEIDYLVLREAAAESELEDSKNLGPWDWNDLGHYQRREFRAFGALAAWLNMYDVRFENNRLRLFEDKDGRRHLRHYVSDLGSGLGSASSLLSYTNSDPVAFPARMIDYRKDTSGSHENVPQMASNELPFSISGYMPIQENYAFARMTMNDMRWMGRKISQISRKQIVDALTAAGYSEADIGVYTAKLLSRRADLLRAIGLPAAKE